MSKKSQKNNRINLSQKIKNDFTFEGNISFEHDNVFINGLMVTRGEKIPVHGDVDSTFREITKKYGVRKIRMYT